MQRATGLDVRWVDADEVRRLIPAMAERRGSAAARTSRPTDGSIPPERARVLARDAAAPASSSASAWRSWGSAPAPAAAARVVTGVETTAGTIATGRVLLAGRPGAAGGREGRRRPGLGGLRPPPGRRDRAEPDLAPRHDRDGVRHRDGHLLAARGGRVPLGHVEPRRGTRRRPLDRLALPADGWNAGCNASCRRRRGLGIKKAWAATIEYTPDHLPLTGPLVLRDGTEVEGASIASACGHGMMWGPAVSRIAADLLLDGATDVVERPRGLPHGSVRRAGTFAVRRPGGAAVPGAAWTTSSRTPRQPAPNRSRYSWRTGQVSVRVIPSSSCMGITVLFAS